MFVCFVLLSFFKMIKQNINQLRIKYIFDFVIMLKWIIYQLIFSEYYIRIKTYIVVNLNRQTNTSYITNMNLLIGETFWILLAISSTATPLICLRLTGVGGTLLSLEFHWDLYLSSCIWTQQLVYLKHNFDLDKSIKSFETFITFI